MSARTWSLLAALLLAGCAENAVLELQIELPAAPDDGSGPWYAHVQVRSATNRFDASWEGADPRSVELGEAPQWDCISVQTGDESVDVNVRVRFCRNPDCQGFGDDMAPERRFFLEHPFYIGRHTYWTTRIERVPECASDADCEAGVCVGGVCGCASDAECCTGSACQCPGEGCFACLAGGCVKQVERCQIHGCVAGDRPASFCTADGAHFCETGGYDRETESYMCTPPG